MFIRHGGEDHLVRNISFDRKSVHTECKQCLTNGGKKFLRYKEPRVGKLCKECTIELSKALRRKDERINLLSNTMESSNQEARDMYRIINYMCEMARQGHPDTRTSGGGGGTTTIRGDKYDFIPYSIQIVLSLFNAIRRNKLSTVKGTPVPNHISSFLDVGCGVGNIMLAAKNVFSNTVHGIEYDEYYVDFCRKITGADSRQFNKMKVFHQDAMNFDKYGEYNIIYFYCPFHDPAQQKRLEKIIEKQMKVGCIYIPFLKQDRSIEKSKKFERIEFKNGNYYPSIYLKVK